MFPKVTILVSLAIAGGLSRAATNVGDATFNPDGCRVACTRAACGVVSKESDFVASIASPLFNSFNCPGCNPKENPVCGKKVTVTAPNGKSVTVAVLDVCEGCGENDIDLSPAAFKVLADLSVGRVHGVKWDL